MFKVKLFKRKGIAYVIPLVLSVLMAMALAGSLYTIHAQSFKSLTAERIEIQAMNFARQKAKEISIAPYSKTVDGTIVETRAPIDGATDWQREVVLPGVEVDLGSGNKKRDVNVNVYLGSELYPRATQTETLTSQGSGSVPAGTILPWWGNLASMPTGFSYCDGTNGTPDLRGRTIFGSGPYGADGYGWINYIIGQNGGERMHRLTIAEMPRHTHTQNIPVDAAGGGVDNPALMGSPNDDEPFVPVGETFPAGNDQPHNIMPPYMIMHWIMKQ